MTCNCEQLEKTITRLQRAISPLASKEHTEKTKAALRSTPIAQIPLTNHVRDGEMYWRLRVPELATVLFEGKQSIKDYTELGRSLQALLWERSAINGYAVFIKSKEDFKRDGY